MAATSSADVSTCTLIYKLNDEAPITFDQFHLIIRALHVYKVVSIKPSPDEKIVIVTLGYNCSMKTVRTKLGNVPATVTKQNPFISNSEISELEALRATFGFGTTTEEEESETPRPAKKPRYKKGY